MSATRYLPGAVSVTMMDGQVINMPGIEFFGDDFTQYNFPVRDAIDFVQSLLALEIQKASAASEYASKKRKEAPPVEPGVQPEAQRPRVESQAQPEPPQQSSDEQTIASSEAAVPLDQTQLVSDLQTQTTELESTPPQDQTQLVSDLQTQTTELESTPPQDQTQLVSDLQAQIAELSSENATINQATITRLNGEIEQLRNQLIDQATLQERYESVVQQLGNLNREVMERDIAIQDLAIQLDVANRQRAALEDERNNARDERDSLTTTMATLEAQVQSLREARNNNVPQAPLAYPTPNSTPLSQPIGSNRIISLTPATPSPASGDIARRNAVNIRAQEELARSRESEASMNQTYSAPAGREDFDKETDIIEELTNQLAISTERNESLKKKTADLAGYNNRLKSEIAKQQSQCDEELLRYADETQALEAEIKERQRKENILIADRSRNEAVIEQLKDVNAKANDTLRAVGEQSAQAKLDLANCEDQKAFMVDKITKMASISPQSPAASTLDTVQHQQAQELELMKSLNTASIDDLARFERPKEPRVIGKKEATNGLFVYPNDVVCDVPKGKTRTLTPHLIMSDCPEGTTLKQAIDGVRQADNKLVKYSKEIRRWKDIEDKCTTPANLREGKPKRFDASCAMNSVFIGDPIYYDRSIWLVKNKPQGLNHPRPNDLNWLFLRSVDLDGCYVPYVSPATQAKAARIPSVFDPIQWSLLYYAGYAPQIDEEVFQRIGASERYPPELLDLFDSLCSSTETIASSALVLGALAYSAKRLRQMDPTEDYTEKLQYWFPVQVPRSGDDYLQILKLMDAQRVSRWLAQCSEADLDGFSMDLSVQHEFNVLLQGTDIVVPDGALKHPGLLVRLVSYVFDLQAQL